MSGTYERCRSSLIPDRISHEHKKFVYLRGLTPIGRGRSAVTRVGVRHGSRAKGSAPMPAERPTRRSTGKRASRPDGSVVPQPQARQSTPAHRFVDIDPWAMLLEQLMEVPEEGSVTGEPGQGGTNDQPEPRRSMKKGRGK